MLKLGNRNYTLISEAVKSEGTFNPDIILCQFEESLYVHEADTILEFLEWVHADEINRGFGHGNYEEQFNKFLNVDTTDMVAFKDMVSDTIETLIDDAFVDAHQYLGTKTGDITPEQAFRLDELKEELIELIIEQTKQNL